MQLLEDYGDFALYRSATPTVAGTRGALAAKADMDVLQFTAQPFDTQRDQPAPPAPFSPETAAGPSLQLVQFVGPVKKEWLDALAARGIAPVQYVASNGYLVWADEAAQAELAALRRSAGWLQYAAPYQSFLKVDPALRQRLAANAAAGDEVDVTVQVYRHDGAGETRQFVQERTVLPSAQQGPLGAGVPNHRWVPILKYENLSLRVRLADVVAIAARADVTFVGITPTFRQMDEKQDVILAGDFAPGPASIDYAQFLTGLGFPQDPAAYPIVDVTDSPVDEGGTGVTVLNTADVKFRVAGDAGQPSRVVYFQNCSSQPDDEVGAIDGHGSLNAGIVAGYDQRSGFPYRDGDGFQLGLGVNPFGRIGSTAIFVPDFDTSGCDNGPAGLIDANWRNGARISSNSWGSNGNGTYEATQQIYDAGVRDADAATAGNQELIYVWAAANSGPNPSTIGIPSAAKNLITVGASENVRPDWTDGCGMGPADADHADDIARFSSRGPAPGGRVKPEVVAPGSHIQSGASNYAGYDTGVCDLHHPAGQTEFAASSGTSHSTPAVSGIASLAYWWIEHGGAGAAAGSVTEVGGARAPSPALMKAWLIAHPSYLSGDGAGDDLPSNNQGYGMPNLSDMFGTTPKVLLDQSDLLVASGEVRDYIWEVADPTRPLRVALAYTDAPGALGTSPQVNDLDLAVRVNGQSYLGNHFDHQWSTPGGSADDRNNYEAVFLPAGASGEVTVTVTAGNIAGDATFSGAGPNQDFALVCSNCRRVSTYTLAAAQSSLQVCAGGTVDTTIRLGQVEGFADPVSLSAGGTPPGTSVTFAPNPLEPPGESTLTLAASESAQPGITTLSVDASSGSIAKSIDLELGVYDAAPPNPALDGPDDGDVDVPLLPTLRWQAAPRGLQLSRAGRHRRRLRPRRRLDPDAGHRVDPARDEPARLQHALLVARGRTQSLRRQCAARRRRGYRLRRRFRSGGGDRRRAAVHHRRAAGRLRRRHRAGDRARRRHRKRRPGLDPRRRQRQRRYLDAGRRGASRRPCLAGERTRHRLGQRPVADFAERPAAGRLVAAEPVVLEPAVDQERLRRQQLPGRRDPGNFGQRRQQLDAGTRHRAADRSLQWRDQRQLRQPARQSPGLVRRSAGLPEFDRRPRRLCRPDRAVPVPPRPRPLRPPRRSELGDRSGNDQGMCVAVSACARRNPAAGAKRGPTLPEGTK